VAGLVCTEAGLAAYPLREKWVRDVAAYDEARLAAYPLREKWVRDVAAYNNEARLVLHTHFVRSGYVML
jgi:hypothetical protein